MFELNGKQYSLEQLEAAADAQNLTFEEFMQAMREKGMVEVQPEPQEFEDPFLQSVKKTIGPVEEAAAVGPEVTAEQPDTDLVSEDISLDSPDPRYIEFNINGEKTYSSYEDVEKEYGNVEDYIRKFRGKAKIVTPPKQLEEVVVEGDAEKTVDPGEYLTEVIEADENFFSRDYDQASY